MRSDIAIVFVIIELDDYVHTHLVIHVIHYKFDTDDQTLNSLS